MISFDSLSRFNRDQGGAVAIMFGLMLFVLVAAVGLAVDVSRGNDAKTALQQDLDATLLYVAAEKARQGSGFDIQSAAQAYMSGLNRSKYIDGTFTLAVSKIDDSTIQGTVDAKVRSQFMGVLGVKELDIAVTSTASAGQSPMELALVLDNTTSMEGAKLTALKDAANSLIDAVFDAAGPGGNIKAGVVPFAEYVNVGVSQRGQSWLSVPNDVYSSSQDLCAGDLSATMVPNTCQTVPNTYTLDGTTYTDTRLECDFQTPGSASTFKCTARDEVVWRGCVGSRPYPFDVRDDTYGSNKVPGLHDTWCPSEITPLTSDRDTVKSAIDGMWAGGNTYVAPGVMWGWAVLSPDAPYTEGRPYKEIVNGKPLRKIMVLMTDGENFNSPSYPHHWNKDVPVANKLTGEVCTNIKSAGIEVYAVAFDVTDTAIKSILESCASGSDHYFDATGTTALDKSFETIAANLSALRLTQ